MSLSSEKFCLVCGSAGHFETSCPKAAPVQTVEGSTPSQMPEFWAYLEQNYKEVANWPGWMRHGVVILPTATSEAFAAHVEEAHKAGCECHMCALVRKLKKKRENDKAGSVEGGSTGPDTPTQFTMTRESIWNAASEIVLANAPRGDVRPLSPLGTVDVAAIITLHTYPAAAPSRGEIAPDAASVQRDGVAPMMVVAFGDWCDSKGVQPTMGLVANYASEMVSRG